MLIVIAGMNTSRMNGSHLLSWSRLARLLLKKSGGQNAASALEHHEHADEHVSGRIGKVADEVAPKDRLEDGEVHGEWFGVQRFRIA